MNRDAIEIRDGALLYRVETCRVQAARGRKGMALHPCKSVGLIEYSGFARTIDDRIRCRCLSCYPEVTDETCSCAWEFTLTEQRAVSTAGPADQSPVPPPPPGSGTPG